MIFEGVGEKIWYVDLTQRNAEGSAEERRGDEIIEQGYLLFT